MRIKRASRYTHNDSRSIKTAIVIESKWPGVCRSQKYSTSSVLHSTQQQHPQLHGAFFSIDEEVRA
jgi:hypothetical protein